MRDGHSEPPAVTGHTPSADGLPTLRVEGLNKRYGRKYAARDVSFAMHTGEIVGLLGPNGAGKTTVFYLIVGFIKPTSGRIYLEDSDITRLPMFRRARRGISYLPQEASIFRKLSVEQNVLAVLETQRGMSRRDRRRRCAELLDELGISELRRQPGYTLSGGERRRTEIARALAAQPKFLLLDEPFAGVDPIAVHEIKSIVKRLAEAGIGVSDHRPQRARHAGDHPPQLHHPPGGDHGQRHPRLSCWRTSWRASSTSATTSACSRLVANDARCGIRLRRCKLPLYVGRTDHDHNDNRCGDQRTCLQNPLRRR